MTHYEANFNNPKTINQASKKGKEIYLILKHK